jgi:hypothetical protein
MIAGLSAAPVLAASEEDSDKLRQGVITPDDAGPDFKLQGEYAGEYETDEGRNKLGIQVIALGEGRFRAVAWPGGLPGDGGEPDASHQVEASREGDSVTFTGEHGKGVLKDGVLSIQNLDGEELGQLKKTERKSPTLGKKPPEGAVVLFPMKADLSDVTLGEGEYLLPEDFEQGRIGKDGLLMPGATSKPTFQDCTLHMEFQLSFMPHAREQARSNSGAYLQGRYEVQILDSFGLEGKHNECGGIYEIADPKVNMCYPPLAWQTYDIDFTAARYENGQKVKPARITVRHNGVVVHNDLEVPRSTRASPNSEGPEPGPVYIQDHGNPLRFRNIWVVKK